MKEISFELNEFREGYIYNKTESIALRLQNLIISEPVMLPNYQDCGVGIKKYLFGTFTDSTKADIQSRIEYNIKTFMGEVANLITMSDIKSNTINGINSFVVYFNIMDPDKKTETSIAIDVKTIRTTNEIISEVYI